MAPSYRAGQFKGGRKVGSKAQSNQGPISEDDYLDEGAAHEASGGKWRSGDSVKSARFFQRALDSYTTGLTSFPKSFDLTFAKAHLLLELTHHPQILAEFGVPTLVYLQETLDTHEAVLKIDETNPETLFNMSQVLMDMAKERGRSERIQARRDLETAGKLLEKCFALQEEEYGAEDDQGEVQTEELDEPDAPSSASSEKGQDVYITESIGPRDLIDTAIGLASTLAELSPYIIPMTEDLLDQHTVVLDSLQQKIPVYINALPSSMPPPSPPPGPTLSLSLNPKASPKTPPRVRSPQEEARCDWELALMTARCAGLDAAFRSGLVSGDDYFQGLSLHAGKLSSETDVSVESDIAAALADVHTAFATSLASQHGVWHPDVDHIAAAHALRQHLWSALKTAKALLAAVDDNASHVMIARADVDILRLRVLLTATSPDVPGGIQAEVSIADLVTAGFEQSKQAVSEIDALRSSARTAFARREAEDEKLEAVVRMAVLEALVTGAEALNEHDIGQQALKQLQSVDKNRVEAILGDMAEEGIVEEEIKAVFGRMIWG